MTSPPNETPWPGGARCAMALTIPVDAETVVLAEGRRYARHPLAMSHQVYEIQRGVPRLLAMLADLGLRATFFVPGWTLERWPRLADDIAGAGHELGHHSYSHRRAVSLGPGEERADFERALEVMQRLGVPPAGHRAASWCPSHETLALVAEHGLRYDTSLMGDDRPYLVETEHGDVVELPAHWALDDFDHYAFLPEPHLGRNVEPPQTAVAVWRAELDGMRRYGGLCQLTCHAMLSGRPGRAAALRRLLEETLEAGDVAFMTCAEAAAHALAHSALARRRDAPVAPAADVATGAR
jgi:peptidoglycan/xylan/chitin deacetylase (PgdA/CDA1 family)